MSEKASGVNKKSSLDGLIPHEHIEMVYIDGEWITTGKNIDYDPQCKQCNPTLDTINSRIFGQCGTIK